MRMTQGAVIGAIVFVCSPLLAADATTPPPSAGASDAVRSSVGLHAGTGGGSERLGQSLDFSLDFALRKAFGSVVLGGGLRPHYERFAFGDSSILSCADTPAACGSSMIVRSHLSANLLSLEVPIIAEFPIAKDTYSPFIGLAPTFGYLRATDTRENLLPTNGESEQSASRGVFTFAAFAGSAMKLTEHGALVFRVGYRFAPTLDDLPGGSASLRGVLASIGYRVTL